jgi:uncharacterized protein
MTLPITGFAGLVLAVVFGFIFGLLLQRAGLANYDTIVNQFRFKDFTVLKVTLTAIVVGGIGVLLLHLLHHATYHIKPANMLAVSLGAAIFGVGMVVYGYCPGTGIAACATGSLHALAGLMGMLAGGIAYAVSFRWIEAHILGVAALGNPRLPDVTGCADWQCFAVLAIVAAVVFFAVERLESSK